jgi:transposase
MISIPAGARILLAIRPVDFRKGAHSLAAFAQEALGEDPFSGAVIVYRAKRSDRIKTLRAVQRCGIVTRFPRFSMPARAAR